MPPYHYDYTRLDKFLQTHYDPKSLAHELDEAMSDLLACQNFSEGRVAHAGLDENYGQVLPERHYVLKSLRDIFSNLEKTPQP